MAKLVFGCGYVGSRVAQRWLEAGERVFALTRSAARATELRAQGISPVIGDVTDRLALPANLSIDTVLYAIGYDRSQRYTIDEVYVEGLARALDAIPLDIGRLIYVSSTGVYGQVGGEWVDEESPCLPLRAGGKAVLHAEQILAAHALGRRAVVLRLAGIYGPGRVPRLKDVQQGRPLAAKGDAFLNLIHVDDAVAAILAAEHVESLPARYIIGDGCPVRRVEFYGELARQLGVAAPRLIEADRASPAAQRELSSKRVRNTKMLAELVPQLHYPSYREGLADVVRAAAQG